MAKREGGSHGFLWFLVGVLAGMAATVGLYFFITRSPAPIAPEPDKTIRLQPPPLPADPAPPPPVALPAPVPSPEGAPPPAMRPAPQPKAEIYDDAAATGMTGPVRPAPSPPGDTAVNPSN